MSLCPPLRAEPHLQHDWRDAAFSVHVHRDGRLDGAVEQRNGNLLEQGDKDGFYREVSRCRGVFGSSNFISKMGL